MTSTNSLLSANATNLASNPLINQNATGSGSSSSGSSSSSSSDLSSLNYNFQEFLTLFTTQLQNQDPTNPMDTTQMTNQLAMFSQVEQQAGTNSRLDKLIAAQPTSGLGSAVGYLGKTIQANGDQVALSGGTAEIAYQMPATATSVKIDVLDSSGSLVTTISGDQASATPGMHQYTWNGTDSSGNTVPDGAYSVTITADDGSGTSSVIPVARTTGKVTGVESDSSGNTVLDLGGIQVKMSDVLAVQS